MQQLWTTKIWETVRRFDFEDARLTVAFIFVYQIFRNKSCTLGCRSNLSCVWQTRNVSSLAETAIYVATVDKFSDVLKTILAWVAENKEEVGDIKMDNADCILHASLEDDKDQVRQVLSSSRSSSFNPMLVRILSEA